MAKLTLTDITSGYLTQSAYNANNVLIEAAIENTLSRDGLAPNNMTADLAMNSQNINNVNNISTQALSIAGTSVVGGALLSVPSAINVPFTQQGTGAVVRDVDAKLQESVSVKDFGAVGDGVTDDSAAIVLARAASSVVFFPSGNYLASVTFTDKTTLIGGGDVEIIGNTVYSEQQFPTSADTVTPLTHDTVFFTASGISFTSTNSTYALSIIGQVSSSFINTHKLKDCKFYGQNGLSLQHTFNFEHTGLKFYNTAIGALVKGSTNSVWIGCQFHNQAAYGVHITVGTDDTTRLGGENHKFVNCEWAVCSTGIKVDRHRWLILNNCLLDFCGLPLELVGSRDLTITNTYLGASATAASTLSGVTGYVASATTKRAVYGLATTSLANLIVSGFFNSCVFVNYIDSSTDPIVELDGSALTRGIVDVSISQCKFSDTNANAAQTHALKINDAGNIRITDSIFTLPNNSSGVDSYSLVNTINIFCDGNNNANYSGTTKAFDQPDFYAGWTNNTYLNFLDSGGAAQGIIRISTADRLILRSAHSAARVELQNSEGTQYLITGPSDTSLMIASSLRLVSLGATDSGGSGFKLLRVPN